eukprot:TRINITY_DN4088_c0_g1_i1.p1 TRINITY_DN4088_c0_g1~~TRINITY_DN4088_c0_g1_i1.p1  ORF type:complete len:438 (+),score=135.56 TRINITY_DN4088_c0_g1_i1:48-1361(+)
MSYSFPNFPNNVILESMKKLNFEITMKSLTEPSTEEVVRICEFFVESLMDIELPIDINGNNQEAFSYPELHQVSVRKIHFIRALGALMPVIGIDDFNWMQDIVTPDPKRLKKMMCAFINFFRFKEKMKETYSEYTRETDTLAENYEIAYQRIQDLSKDLELYTEQNKQNEPLALELERDCSQLSENLIKINKQYTDLRNVAEEKKKQYMEEKVRYKTLQELFQKEKQDCETVRAQIVPDPERILLSFQEMRDSIEMKEKTIQQSTQRSQQMTNKISSLKEISVEIDNCNNLMQECLAFKEKIDKQDLIYSNLSQDKKKLENEIQISTDKEQQIKRHITKVNEKINELPNTISSKIESARLELEKYKDEEKKLLKEEMPLKYDRIQKDQIKVEDLQSEIESLYSDHQNYIDEINQNFSILNQVVKSYHQKILESLEKD